MNTNTTANLDIYYVGKLMKFGNQTRRQVSAQLVAAMKKTSAYMSQNSNYGWTTRAWIGGVVAYAPSKPICGGDIEQVAGELEALGFIVTRDGYTLHLVKPEWID